MFIVKQIMSNMHPFVAEPFESYQADHQQQSICIWEGSVSFVWFFHDLSSNQPNYT